MYISKLFQKYGVLVGSTTNDLNFKRDPLTFEKNKTELYDKLNVNVTKFFHLKQVHSNLILETPFINEETEGDGIILKSKNILAGIKTADCIPLVLMDTESKVIILLHVGRKGAREGIITKAFKILENCYNSKPSNLIAYIGPCLYKKDHIVFEEELEGFDTKYYEPLPPATHIINNQALYDNYKEKFKLSDEYFKNKNSGFFDLKAFVIDEIMKKQISIDNIDDSKINTFDDPSYHSYRRDYPNNGLTLTFCFVK
ncbi:MAG: polyphenol oxidase family protein [Patescibacteria group bacterium]